MNFKSAIEQISGFRYLVDNTPVLSAVGRRALHQLPWLVDAAAFDSLYKNMEAMTQFLNNDIVCVDEFDHLIAQVRDIEQTLTNLSAGMVLSDIELFEIKAFALVIQRLSPLLDKIGNLPHFSSIDEVVEILDPEHSRSSAFYIYDIYSPRLAEVRAQLRKLNPDPEMLLVSGDVADKANSSTNDAAYLYQLSLELEDEVRKALSEKLITLVPELFLAMKTIAEIDILQAKVRVAAKFNMVKPVVAAETSYKALINPQIEQVLLLSGKKYQPVDISFSKTPTLLSGINMGGKTVCLKTIALAQCLFQFGFFVPARSAEIAIVNDIMILIDDKQNDLCGLSSFAGEMKQLDTIIKTIYKEHNTLVIIDELARTTNPFEGRAIVEAMLSILAKLSVPSFVSSHYDNINVPVRRLRVKGLRSVDSILEMDLNHIDKYIDYSLVADDDTSVPHEALRIARLIGMDEHFLSVAEQKISVGST